MCNTPESFSTDTSANIEKWSVETIKDRGKGLFLLAGTFNKSTHQIIKSNMITRIIAFILLLILAPLFVVIGLFILIEDGFPVFFKQKRVGVNYTFFWIYKFRSMKKNTPDVATHLLGDPTKYLLKSGSLIRKLSLDELPNLINIVKGDMVFVGPRPALYNQDDLMALRMGKGIEKLKPGITGWAQINGRDEISLEEKVSLEKEYLERKSTLFDLRIIVHTFTSVLASKGVKH
jgi:O-antigen biosynthesis protein WbqP